MVKAQAVADAAVSLLSLKTIPYVLGSASLSGMDCIGLVQYCVRKAGGESNFVGSNDLWRHGLEWSGTIAEAQSQGRLIPGAAMYVVKHDGSEPAKYQGDGYGNAVHIGMYCGEPNAEIVSASSVKMKVNATTLKQGWTHVAWLQSIDYGCAAPIAPDSVSDEETHPESYPYTATVTTPDDGRLNLRDTPTTVIANILTRAGNGSQLQVLEENADGWSHVEYTGVIAWAQSQFLQPVQQNDTISEEVGQNG